MKKMFVFTVMLGVVFAVQAKQLEKPDENTLWMEDGAGIELKTYPGFSHWLEYGNGKELEIKQKENGAGFSFFAKDASGRKTMTRLKLDPEYPYLTFRITSFNLLNGYRNWTLLVDGMMSTSQVNAPETGIYVFDLFGKAPEKSAGQKAAYLHVYLSNLGMALEYIKLVRKPAYNVRVECTDPEIRPGSKVKFIAELENEAEDVSLSLSTDYVMTPVSVNGAGKIQLKPTDKTQKIWTSEVEIRSLGLTKAQPRHRTLIKMNVLGGELDEPVWIGIPYPVAP